MRRLHQRNNEIRDNSAVPHRGGFPAYPEWSIKMRKSFNTFAIMAAAAFALAACGGQAHAAPTAVVNANGTAVYGTEQAVSIEKDTSAGYNRTKVKYSSGVQYVNDDAAWSKFAKLQAGLSIPVAASPSLVYDIAKTNGITCANGNSVIAWPNIGLADSLADGCAFFNAAKSTAQ